MSRFSNRQIHLYPHANESFETGLKNRIQLCIDLLSIPETCEQSSLLCKASIQSWNSHILELFNNQSVIDCVKQMYEATICERIARNFLVKIHEKKT